MQEYLQRSLFREILDGAGIRCLIVLLSLGWFCFLWGVTLPAVFSGLALALLILLLRRKTRDGRLKRRETNLRRRIGGEMALEKLLYLPPEEANANVFSLLASQYPLSQPRAAEGGLLCRLREEKALLSFCQLPPEETVGAREVLTLQRTARKYGAGRGILCAPCEISPAAFRQAEGEIPVTFLSRSALIPLIGRQQPADDGQLVALGKRRKQQRPVRWLRLILDPGKAARCAAYGALLLGMYALTGLFYYAVPGLICVSLAAACRCVPPRKNAL